MNSCSILEQLVALALTFILSQRSESFICEDHTFTPGTLDGNNSSMKFDLYRHHSIRGPKKITFQRLSAEQCALLCLQVAEGNMYHCSSFEHVTNTNECLLMESTCSNGSLLVDTSRLFGQLKESKLANSCKTLSSSTSGSLSIKPTSSVHSQFAASSVARILQSQGGTGIIINVTVLLPNETWHISLENSSSDEYLKLSSRIKQSVVRTVGNHTTLLRVKVVRFRNESGLVIEFKVIFSQDVHMGEMNRLYFALYEAKHLDAILVRPISDTVAGKPPKTMNVTLIRPTVLHLSWTRLETLQAVNTWGLRIVYKRKDNKTNSVVVDKTRTQLNITGLQRGTFYQVWSVSVTSRGFGIASRVLNITTLQEDSRDVVIKFTVLLPNVSWNAEFKNKSSREFTNVWSIIKNSLGRLHQNESDYKNISSLQLRSHSTCTVAGVTVLYDPNSGLEDFFSLYAALYKHKKLGEFQVTVLDDNIPGKPPSNISAVALSSTSISMRWNLPWSNHCEIFQSFGFRVSYQLNNDDSTTRVQYVDTNTSISHLVINNLEKFEYYVIWLQQLTSHGPGAESQRFQLKTLEEVVPIDLTVRLNDMQWNENLSDPNSNSFKNLCRQLQENVIALYGAGSAYLRGVQCHRFKNGSVLADLTIVYGQNVGASQFATIYIALYQDGRLGNLSAQPVNDRVPGKPPTNIKAESKSSTSIQLAWACAECHEYNTTIGFFVSYKLDLTNETTSHAVNRSTRTYLISGLKKFANYTLHVTGVTSRGLGVPSHKVSTRTKEDVPSSPPFNLRAINTSSTSLLVTWDPVPSEHVNGILLGYLLIYKKHDDVNSKHGNVTTTLNLTELSGLEKYSVYDVNISAFTSVGNGPEAHVTTATDQDVPSLPPTDIRARNTSSTSLLVTWNAVPCDYAHGIVLGYQVFYKREKDLKSSVSNVTSQLHSFELTRLDKYTRYVVKVLAFTVKGSGVVSNATSARTHEDVPSLPPTHLVVHNTSSTGLMVKWRPVPEGYVHGVLQGYRIRFQVQGVSSWSNLTTTNQSLELQALEKFTVYSIQVLAFTAIGDGNVSKPVWVSTDEDVPSFPPQNATSYNTSSTSLHVSWDEVPQDFVHGVLLGYRIFYKPARSSKSYDAVITANSTRQVELLGLEKFTIYELTIVAFTRIGDGANSTRILVPTDEDIPSKPPVGLGARNTSSTSFLASWDEVPRGFVHGILQGYRVFYKKVDDVNGSYVNSTTGPNERRRHVTALEKYTKYAVKVLAFTRIGDGVVSANISVLTDEDVPSLPPQTVQSYNTSSTSVNVTWLEVPDGFVHGTLRGYRVFYSKPKDNGANVMQSVVSHNARHVQLTGLAKFTNYSIRVAAFTRIGFGAMSPPVQVSTDEDIPSLPPQNVIANNISSTALRITWDPVPHGFVHGILRGYRVLCRKSSKPLASFTVITVPPRTRVKEVRNLEKYTNYTISVLAFTIKGDGAKSRVLRVSTDEDIPSEPPQNVYTKDRASATVIYVRWQRPPENTIHGILQGYNVWYSIVKIGIYERNPVFPKDFLRKQLQASPGSEYTALTGLESFATYNIRIAAFTSKGYGPVKEISTRTCRCRSTIPTNWWHNPPYVTSHLKSNNSEDSGIILTVVEGIIHRCCQWCEEFGTTELDLITDARGLKAEKEGVIQVKDSIGSQTMISFAIAGVMEQEMYHSLDGAATFVAIMETPGVAFVVADKRDIHKEVLMAILSCWPPVLMASMMTYLAGIVIWMLDMKWNPNEFPKSFILGSLEGFWWSFVTMTTVGYGDRIPKSIPARMFAYLWTLTGIAIVAVITSSVTASLMSMVFQPERMLYGTEIAAIANSTEYKLGLRRNAIFDSSRAYGNIDEIYDDLKSDRVHAALLDLYSTASASKKFSTPWLRVIEIIPVRYHSANGIVLSGDVMKLGQCFHDYVASEGDNIHRTIQKNVESIQADDVPFAVKTSSDLLGVESYVYQKAMIMLGIALGAFTLFGLLWHFCRREKKTPSQCSSDPVIEVVTPTDSQMSRGELREQLKLDIKMFYDAFRKKYCALRRRHIKQLKELRKSGYYKRGKEPLEMRQFEFPAGRKGHYEVTKAVDVNSIFEGLDITMFDKKDGETWQ